MWNPVAPSCAGMGRTGWERVVTGGIRADLEPLSTMVGQTLARTLSSREGDSVTLEEKGEVPEGGCVGTLGESHIGHARGRMLGLNVIRFHISTTRFGGNPRSKAVRTLKLSVLG